MRREIYEKVREALLGGGLAKHVDLWNQNVEFIEEEDGWDRPAVFVEFGPIMWTAVKDGAPRGSGQLRLHIVTDWAPAGFAAVGGSGREGQAVDGDCWGLCGRIESALRGLRGASFHELRLTESLTNHNHEDLVETIEVYDVRGVRPSPESGVR